MPPPYAATASTRQDGERRQLERVAPQGRLYAIVQPEAVTAGSAMASGLAWTAAALADRRAGAIPVGRSLRACPG